MVGSALIGADRIVAGQHPGVFVTAALARVHDQRSATERDAREPTGHDANALAEQHVGPKIDTSTFEVPVDDGGVAAETDRGLSDVSSGIFLNPRAKIAAL